jgi:rhamnopyranosyl-N-acetylglucosaminyl-diphospho-decaprenol beta-1,3/1,4-galactofuranosyltransferase
MNNETVCAVVVTYNRKKLLTECLEALENQTRPVDAIYIVDNASTDGTPELLLEKGYIDALPTTELNESLEKTLKKNNITIHYLRMLENTGGAGGFHEGVKNVYRKGYDWLWLMDDDTVVTKYSLGTLMDKISSLNNVKIGFASSKVLWNNEIHLMNLPLVSPLLGRLPFNFYEDKGILLVKHSSFVSSLINRHAIHDLGFPIKEFFIWGEDTEYTDRITENGYLGLYVPESRVYHKTKENYNIDIYNAKIQDSWKYHLGIRNQLYIAKRHGFLSFLNALLYNLIYINWNILKKRNNYRARFFYINTKATLAAIFFRPKILKD